MCSCPAHRSLVDCACSCDHTNDRVMQLGERVLELETQLQSRWRWLETTGELQRTLGHELPLADEPLARWLQWNATGLVTELGEALQEAGWKPWSTPQGWVNRERFLGECVDIAHFLGNMLVAVGITDEEWESAYRRKQQVNRERHADNAYDTRKEKCPACGRAYDDAGTHCKPATSDGPYCEDYGYLETADK